MKMLRLSLTFFCPMYSRSHCGRNDNSTCCSSVNDAPSTNLVSSPPSAACLAARFLLTIRYSFELHCLPRQLLQRTPERDFEAYVRRLLHHACHGFFSRRSL